eukprot:77834_1
MSHEYTNPVADCNCPDPGALYYNGFYYAVTTGDGSKDTCAPHTNCFPIRRSEDAMNWTVISYVFPNDTQPIWTLGNGFFWAPEIHQINDNTFNVYFVAQDTENNNLLSIGVVTSSTPYGPFEDPLHKPLITANPTTRIGYIDPHYFRDPLTDISYLLYKYDGNDATPAEPTPIYMQKLSDNGHYVVDDNVIELITNDRQWECHDNSCLVEAPWMIYNAVTKYYYLFYSATRFDSAFYSVGVARSRTVDAGFVKFDGTVYSWG